MGILDFLFGKRKEAEDRYVPAGIEEDYRKKFYRLENIKCRAFGNGLMLAPYDAAAYFELPDAQVISAFANTPKIKRFLPGLSFETEASTRNMLKQCMLKVESQLGVTYVIRGASVSVPIGMIFVNTPLYNRSAINLAIWTIDFYMSDQFQHKGYMYKALVRVLPEIRIAMGAKKIYALVDTDNYECQKLIGNGLFKRINVSGFENRNNGQPPLVYMADLLSLDNA